jgi:hypothetical protein
MSNDKTRINDTVLFKDVAKKIGATEALSQLMIAFNSYTGVDFGWDFPLSKAFVYGFTHQGIEYWSSLK